MPPASSKNKPFRCGFVALIGRPNVGKSTLMNRLIGQKVAITSSVAQTTRHRIKGILTLPKQGQIIFLDTPGFSKPLDSLGNYLCDESAAGLSEADAILVVVDGSQMAGKGDQWVLEQAATSGKPIILAINKIDTLKNKPEQQKIILQSYKTLLKTISAKTPHPIEHVSISARNGKNIQGLETLLLPHLPEGPALYPDDAVTDQRIREISAEMIREKILRNTTEEIPHSVAIAIDRFEEQDHPPLAKIYATLYVDQKSQKGILIGHQGSMIKKIGSEARKEIETLMEHQVYLELTVKVRQNWRKDTQFLKSLGLALPTPGA